MQDLDDDVMSLFYKSENQTVEQSRQVSSIILFYYIMNAVFLL